MIQMNIISQQTEPYSYTTYFPDQIKTTLRLKGLLKWWNPTDTGIQLTPKSGLVCV